VLGRGCPIYNADANTLVKAMLPPLRANEGNKLQLYMYMSGS
jgi:hypothetical protein